MEVPVLLIEFEGVLADTARLRRDALAEAFAVDGLTLTAAAWTVATGRCTEDAVERVRATLGAPEDHTAADLCRARAERAFASRAGSGLSLQPGARDAMESLAGIARLALVTRAARREVEFVLDLAGLDGLFRPLIALEDVHPPKPDAAPYRAAMAKVAQLFPGQTLRGLAIEDSLVGVRAARAAGLPAVLIGDFAAHEAMEADAWIESIAALTPERVRALTAHRAEDTR
jgi:HAD superfamily hydrolase (TIGR01509 family)